MLERDAQRAVAAVVRELGRTRAGGAVFRRAYRAAARTAAAFFSRIDGVDGVYITGSTTHPAFIEPGSSDIDLVIAIDVPTLASEIAVRRKLARVHRMIHAAVPAFTNLDVVENRDFDLLRRFGNAWTLDFDRRWEHAAGNNRLEPSRPSRPERERRLELAALSFKRWMKASTFIQSPAGAPRAKGRMLQRLLIDVASAYVDKSRFSPLRELVDEAARRSGHPEILSAATEDASASVRLASALTLLDVLAVELSEKWQGRWTCDGERSRVEPPDALRDAARRFGGRGFSAVFCPRGPDGGGGYLVAVANDGDDVADVLRRGATAVDGASETSSGPARPAWLVAPVVVTRAMWRAGALFPPSPFVAPALSTGTPWSLGPALPAPGRPPDEEASVLVRARVMQQFVRRVVRARRGASAFRRELDYEHHALRPALAHAMDAGRFRFADDRVESGAASASAFATATHSKPDVDEDEVRELRAWLDARRIALRSI
jgi:predicted nucleotidyltransferase